MEKPSYEKYVDFFSGEYSLGEEISKNKRDKSSLNFKKIINKVLKS